LLVATDPPDFEIDSDAEAAAATESSADSVNSKPESEDEDLEEGVPDTAIKKKKGKKQKKGQIVRDRINKVAADIAQPNLEVQKRKALEDDLDAT
jgi:hypothetical protein